MSKNSVSILLPLLLIAVLGVYIFLNYKPTTIQEIQEKIKNVFDFNLVIPKVNPSTSDQTVTCPESLPHFVWKDGGTIDNTKLVRGTVCVEKFYLQTFLSKQLTWDRNGELRNGSGLDWFIEVYAESDGEKGKKVADALRSCPPLEDKYEFPSEYVGQLCLINLP